MKQFVIEEIASTPISLDNAAFMFCSDLPRVKSLDVHESASIVFQSGRGSSRVKVVRVPDREPIGAFNGATYCGKCGSLVCGHERQAT